MRRTARADGTVLESRVIWPCKDGFVLWALSQEPPIIVPLVSAAVGFAAWRLSHRLDRHRLVLPVAAVLFSFVLSELLLERLYPPYAAFWEELLRRITANAWV